MKRICIFLLAMMFAGAIYGQNKKVAVYVTGGSDAGVNKVLGDQLVAAFTQSGKYTAIERTGSFLAELRKEQDYQRTGNVNDREISRLGKQFGVQLVCVAEVNDVFGEKYVSARLVDVETAEVVNTSNASSSLKDMPELLKVSEKITTELSGKTAKEKAAEEAIRTNAKKVGYYILNNLAVSTEKTNTMDWEKAKTMVREAAIGGYMDWRLPTISELVQIYANCDIIWSKVSESPFQALNWKGFWVGAVVWSSTPCTGGQQTIDGGGENTCWQYDNPYYGGRVVLVRDMQ
jgi:hypothetical protein